MRLLIAVCLALLGMACVVVAAVNLFNVDRQPWPLRAKYVLVGVAALWAAFYLAQGTRGKSGSPAA